MGFIFSEETPSQGLLIEDGVNMRLMALTYQKPQRNASTLQPDTNNHASTQHCDTDSILSDPNMTRLVLAEPLPNIRKSKFTENLQIITLRINTKVFVPSYSVSGIHYGTLYAGIEVNL